MGVRRQQQETPETLEVFVFNDTTHQFLGQTLAAMRLEDEYVGKQRERRPVRDNAGKTDLRGAMVHTEAEGIFDRALDFLHHLPLQVLAWGSEHEAAGLARDAIYLLRPDTYVGLAEMSGAPDVIERYLADRGIRLPGRPR